eukprot:COSAG01_NODE_920_length_12728_cov_38.396864_4_plen_61_part_00
MCGRIKKLLNGLEFHLSSCRRGTSCGCPAVVGWLLPGPSHRKQPSFFSNRRDKYSIVTSH